MAAANGSFSSPRWPATAAAAAAAATTASRNGKGREHSAHPDSPGRVRGGPGLGPRGAPGWDDGGAGADGGGWRRARLFPSPSLTPRLGSD